MWACGRAGLSHQDSRVYGHPKEVVIGRGGHTIYGYELGVLMLDTTFPRLVGDVSNAATWPFPVRYRIVTGATSRRVVQQPDTALADLFVEAAQDLEAEGVPMITTSCGFLALYQERISSAVSVPFLSSSLLQVPDAARLVGPNRKVGILTMSRQDLTETHYEGVGWSTADIPVVVSSFGPGAAFWETYLVGRNQVDPAELEAELLGLTRDMLNDHPEVAALVLECTNFSPFAPALRQAFRIPVFDLGTLVFQTHLAISGVDFRARQ